MSGKKIFLALIVVTLLGAFAMVSLAGARARATTKVTIHGDNGDYQGRVISDRAKCWSGRTVVVYKQKGTTQEPSVDKKIGSDTSERHGDHGDWAIGNSGFKHGDFYAKVRGNSDCKGDFSRTISR